MMRKRTLFKKNAKREMKNQKRNTTNEENNPAKKGTLVHLVIIIVITITEKMNKTLITEKI